LNPLVPFADACLSQGHDVLAAGPPALADAIEARGYPYWPFDDPPEDELGEVWSRVPSLSPDEQNVVVIGEIFGRLDATASLRRLREACDEWAPDVVLRDPNEYGSAIAAEAAGIPHARVGIGLASVEELSLGIAAAPIDRLRGSAGLAPDQDGAELRGSPYLTMFPTSLEDPAVPEQVRAARFRDPAWDASPDGVPAWSGDGARPLVYVTFGSVAGAIEQFAQVYDRALEAVADLPVSVLLTVGHGADLDRFAGAPDNVRVERWVPQAEVLPRASAVVHHGGSGSTLGALAAGVPAVVVPLFADQPYNARRVEAAGAGLVVAPPDAGAIRDAVERLIEDPTHGEWAERLAAEMRSQQPIEEAVELLAGLAADGRPGR
jgi:UDP:flavonoid glycosyltransferase YjiC (YdhE family)